MKPLITVLFCIIIATSACNKTKSNKDCTLVTITNAAPGCPGWGITVNGRSYPSRNIPAAFQQNNLVVCASYQLFEDMTLCACCGGTWADIRTIELRD
ncbi:MAG: hypothetical protein ABL876_16690 [Chitinophagaceae bacterium]